MTGGYVAVALGHLYFSRFSDPTYVASLVSYVFLPAAAWETISAA